MRDASFTPVRPGQDGHTSLGRQTVKGDPALGGGLQPRDEDNEPASNEDRVREWKDPPYDYPDTSDRDPVNESKDPDWPFPSR
jgi:hypothetical protein